MHSLRLASDDAGDGKEPKVFSLDDPLRHPGLPEMFEGEQYQVLATESEVDSSEGDVSDEIDTDDLEYVCRASPTQCAPWSHLHRQPFVQRGRVPGDAGR